MPTFQPSALPAGAYRVSNKNHDYWIVDADGNIIGQTGANGQDTFFASYQTDSNGNVVGLLGPGGKPVILPSITPNQSIMWMGDSLIAVSGMDSHPLVTPRTPYFSFAVSSWTTWIRTARVPIGTPAGAGTLTFDKTAQTLTWAAFGETAGPAVDVSAGGWFRLESSVAGHDCCVTLLKANEPASGTNTVTVTGSSTYVGNTFGQTFVSQWNAYRGNPFGENQYFYAGSGFTPTQLVLSQAQWEGIYTDITVIDIGTNGVDTVATADSEMLKLLSIISARQAAGSRCIVSTINLNNNASDTVTQAESYFNSRLLELSKSWGFETFDANPYLTNELSGTLSLPGKPDCYNTDALHLSAKGAYFKAVFALDPVLYPYVRRKNVIQPALASYDSALSPKGNLVVNGQFLGSAAATGTRMSGEKPSNWTQNCVGGSVLAAVGKMPAGATPVARTDRPGYWAVWDLNNAGGVAGEYLQCYSAAFISGSNYSAGDTIIMSGECMVQAVAANPGVIGIQMQVGSTSAGQIYALYSLGTGVAPLGDCNGGQIIFKFESMPLTLPVGATNLSVAFNVLMAAGGTATFGIGQNLCVRKIQ